MILSENAAQRDPFRCFEASFPISKPLGARAVSDEVPIEHHTVQGQAEHLEGRLKSISTIFTKQEISGINRKVHENPTIFPYFP
jgi:hypothetical protein